MSRAKLIKKVIEKASKLAEKTGFKGKKFRAARTVTGPGGRKRKLSGRTEKAVAAQDAKKLTEASARRAKIQRRVTGGVGAVGAGATGVVMAKRKKKPASNVPTETAKPASKKPAAKPPVNPYTYSPGQSNNARAALAAAREGASKTTAVKKTAKKVAKKTAKMASVPTVRNPRTPTTGPKTKVPVGSSIIRNKDGSIKKIKKPSGKAPKNKFDRMTTSQLNRLSGKEAAEYRKYKKSKKK